MNQSFAAQVQRNKYLETAVQTASPAQLLIMLYDGAIRFCRSANEAIRVNDMQEANRCIIRAQDIVLEFVVSLDKTAPVADGLVQLYDYIYRQLIDANVKKDSAVLVQVIDMLQELKETWVQAAKGGIPASAGVVHG